jgi:hypothetical protein
MTRVHARVGGPLTVRWVRDGSTTLVFRARMRGCTRSPARRAEP